MQYNTLLHVLAVITAVPVALALLDPLQSALPVNTTTHEKRQFPPGTACDCYSVSGPDPGFFQHHHFWDFRQVPLNVLGAQTQPSAQNAGTANQVPGNTVVPLLLKDTPFGADWLSQDWQRSGSLLFPIPIANSHQNVFLTRSLAGGPSFLAMRTQRFETYSSTAEIETSISTFMHVSFRIRLRVLGHDEPIISPPVAQTNAFGKRGEEATAMAMANTNTAETPLIQRVASQLPPSVGACVGIFTFFSTTSESDIEILTSDPPNRVHYANQPDYDPVRNIVIPGSQIAADSPIPWTTWSTYRLDWFPGMSRWYVENQLQASLAYGVPVDPSRMIINVWSDGGLWSGNLTVGDSVHLGIEWIEMAYNLTGEAPRPCNVVCRIDNVANQGAPEM